MYAIRSYYDLIPPKHLSADKYRFPETDKCIQNREVLHWYRAQKLSFLFLFAYCLWLNQNCFKDNEKYFGCCKIIMKFAILYFVYELQRNDRIFV